MSTMALRSIAPPASPRSPATPFDGLEGEGLRRSVLLRNALLRNNSSGRTEDEDDMDSRTDDTALQVTTVDDYYGSPNFELSQSLMELPLPPIDSPDMCAQNQDDQEAEYFDDLLLEFEQGYDSNGDDTATQTSDTSVLQSDGEGQTVECNVTQHQDADHGTRALPSPLAPHDARDASCCCSSCDDLPALIPDEGEEPEDEDSVEINRSQNLAPLASRSPSSPWEGEVSLQGDLAGEEPSASSSRCCPPAERNTRGWEDEYDLTDTERRKNADRRHRPDEDCTTRDASSLTAPTADDLEDWLPSVPAAFYADSVTSLSLRVHCVDAEWGRYLNGHYHADGDHHGQDATDAGCQKRAQLDIVQSWRHPTAHLDLLRLLRL